MARLNVPQMGQNGDLPGLVKALKSKNYENKEMAVRWLSDLAPKEEFVVDALIETLSQPIDWANPIAAMSLDRVRHVAVLALAKIGDKKATFPLINTLPNCDSFMRGAVAYALGELGDIRAKFALTTLSKDKDRDVSENAAKALKKISGKIE